MWTHRIIGLGLFWVMACSGSSTDKPVTTNLLENPLAAFPTALSSVGLYPDLNDVTIVAEAVLEYTPMWPLWSNGSEKRRYIQLPEGAIIDNSDSTRWIFPVGTLLFKTFLFPHEEDLSTLRPVETRILRKAETEWEYAAYLWNESSTEATLLAMKKTKTVSIVGPDGELADHKIPSRRQCRQCHESSQDTVLGFNELQLNGDSGVELTRIVENGLLSQAPADPAGSIGEHDALTSAFLGYLQGNCVACHNGTDGPSSSFDLRAEVALENLIDQPTNSTAALSGIRVIPGNPQDSILYQGISGETDDPEVKNMPPVGVQILDETAISLVYDWILSL